MDFISFGHNNSRDFCSFWCLSYVVLFVSAHRTLAVYVGILLKTHISCQFVPFIHWSCDLYPSPCLAPSLPSSLHYLPSPPLALFASPTSPASHLTFLLRSSYLVVLSSIWSYLIFTKVNYLFVFQFCIVPLYQSNNNNNFLEFLLIIHLDFILSFFSRALLEIEFPSDLILKKEK